MKSVQIIFYFFAEEICISLTIFHADEGIRGKEDRGKRHWPSLKQSCVQRVHRASH